MSNPGSGDPFGGDKRTDETVMIGQSDLNDLVAQAKAQPAPAPEATPSTGDAIVSGVEEATANSSKTILIVGAVVLVLALIGILVVAL